MDLHNDERKIENYMTELPCPICKGARLNDGVLSVLINKDDVITSCTRYEMN